MKTKILVLAVTLQTEYSRKLDAFGTMQAMYSRKQGFDGALQAMYSRKQGFDGALQAMYSRKQGFAGDIMLNGCAVCIRNSIISPFQQKALTLWA